MYQRGRDCGEEGRIFIEVYLLLFFMHNMQVMKIQVLSQERKSSTFLFRILYKSKIRKKKIITQNH